MFEKKYFKKLKKDLTNTNSYDIIKKLSLKSDSRKMNLYIEK